MQYRLIKYLTLVVAAIALGVVLGRQTLTCKTVDVYENNAVTCDGRQISGSQKPDIVSHEYFYR